MVAVDQAGLSAVAVRRRALELEEARTNRPRPSTSQGDQLIQLDAESQNDNQAQGEGEGEGEGEDVGEDDNRSTQEGDQPNSSRRYFDHSPSPQPVANASSSAPQTPQPSPYVSKLKNSGLKRRRQRATFSDPNCVSNWEAVWDGDRRNVVRLSVPQSATHPVIIGIQLGESLILKGTFRLSVLSGTVQISGAKIQGGGTCEPLDVFAPVSHPLPIIDIPDLPLKPSSPLSSPLDPSAFAAIIQIEDLHTGIQGLDQVWSLNGPRRPLWPSLPLLPDAVSGSTWDLILSLTPEVARLRTPRSWSSSLNRHAQLMPGPVSRQSFIVQGPKGVGKSTFVSLLLNSLLGSFERVALLDLDPGQPLLTPPTLISLHLLDRPILGPGFCHQTLPSSWLRAHYLGEISPKDCPGRYLECVEDLVECFRLEHDIREPALFTPRQRRRHQRLAAKPAQRPSGPGQQRCADQVPLVVNTMGWTTGLGAELLARVRELVDPTTSFVFDAEDSANVEALESIGDTPLSLRLPPSDMRTLSLLAYLYANSVSLGESNGASTQFFRSWRFDQPLTHRRPYALRSTDVELELLDEYVPRSHLGYVLNGSLVAICVRNPVQCLGLALIRTIDSGCGKLFLLTPALPQPDEKAVALVKGHEPALPLLVAVHGTESDQVIPYLEARGKVGGASSTLVGAEKKRIRRNVMRWAQRT